MAGKDKVMDEDRPCPCGRSHTAAEHSYNPEREAAQARAEDIANGLVDEEPDRSVEEPDSDDELSPDIEDWYVPVEGDDVYPEYAGKVLHGGTAYSPEQVETFAHELLGLAQEARRQGPKAELPTVPEDFPVRPLGPDEHPAGRTTCGTCGRSWDDNVSTTWTPAPSGRCPFEYFHAEES